MTNEPCTKIVIDAANLIHDDRGIEKYDEEGEQITQMIPQRLVSAIEHCQEKGYDVVALLKEMTYKWGLREYKANNSEYANFDSIVDLKETGCLKLIKSKNDDLFIIEHALSENALILTRDWFNDHREERPELDWSTVDSLRINEYEFIDNAFTCPKIRPVSLSESRKQDSNPLDELALLVEAQGKEIQSLKERVHELEERDLSKEIASMTQKEIESTAKKAKQDSSRAKSPTQSAEEYARRSKQNGFKKIREKAALLKDIQKRGLASNQGAGLVLHQLEKLKVINVHKNSVKWRNS